MMLHWSYATASRQNVFEVTAPPRRVFAGPVAARCGAAQDALDPTTNPIRRFIFLDQIGSRIFTTIPVFTSATATLPIVG
jgi:hypothetical protein